MLIQKKEEPVAENVFTLEECRAALLNRGFPKNDRNLEKAAKLIYRFSKEYNVPPARVVKTIEFNDVAEGGIIGVKNRLTYLKKKLKEHLEEYRMFKETQIIMKKTAHKSFLKNLSTKILNAITSLVSPDEEYYEKRKKNLEKEIARVSRVLGILEDFYIYGWEEDPARVAIVKYLKPSYYNQFKDIIPYKTD